MQDLKPSNVLVFELEGSKVADLACASTLHLQSPTDGYQIPGDIGYAPPEHFYGLQSNREFSDRCLADLYLLGSLFFFYFGHCSATQAIQAKIRGFKGINFTNASFTTDLPYIRQAFSEALLDLETRIEAVAGNLTSQIVETVSQLCEPDPARRGDPKNIGTLVPQHNMERFVSQINLLASKAELHIL